MLLSNLNLLATAPGGVARLRELILTLAVQGKLVAQNPKDAPASELLKKIRTEKDRLIVEGKIKRDKPLAEIAEEEKPFGLPQGWRWARLDSLSTIGLTDGDWIETKDQDPNGAVRLVQLADIGDGLFKDKSDRYISIETCRSLNCTLLQPSDVLIARLPNPIGRACVFPGLDQAAITAVDVAICRIESELLPEFVSLAINAPTTRNLIESYGKGATRFRVSTGHLKTLPFAVPPKAEQSRIVTRVKELMRLCDAIEAKGQLEATQHAQLVSTLLATLTERETPAQLADNWHRIATHFDLLLDRPEAVDALEQTILQLAVRGLLIPQDPQDEPASELLKKIRAEKGKLIAQGKSKRNKPLPPIAKDEQPFALPHGWEWLRMGDVLDGGSGATPLRARADYFASGTEMWVKTTDLTNGIVNTCEELITKAAVVENRLKYFPAGTVCVAMYGGAGTIGKSGVLGVSSTINQSVFALPPTEGIDVGFLHTYVITVRSQWMSFAAGLRKDPNINGQIIKKMVMPLPPLAEQSRIVTRVAQLRRLCDDLRQRLTASQSTQAHLAEALVKEVA